MADESVVAGTRDEVRRHVDRLAVQAAGIGTFDWELATGRLTWDEQLCEIFGVAEAGFGETIEAFYERVHPEDRADVAQAVDAAVATGAPFEIDYRVVVPELGVRRISAREVGRVRRRRGPASRRQP